MAASSGEIGRDRRDLAYLELQSRGSFGPAGAELLRAVVGTVAGAWRPAPSYPTLDERWTWDPVDIDEAVNEFLLCIAESGKLNTLILEATDGATLERGLNIRCRSWFQDRAKATDAGAFYRKLVHALRRGHELGEVTPISVPDGTAWHRPVDPPEVFRGNEDSLLEAAFETEVEPLHYRSTARRDPMTAWRGVLDVALAVLTEAAMAVLTAMLHRIGLRRFGIDARDDVELTDLNAPGEDTLDPVLAEHCAAEVIAALQPEDLRLLAVRSAAGVNGVMAILGRKKAAAEKATAAARGRLIAVMTALDLIEDGSFGRVVAERVLAIGRERYAWTESQGMSSENEGGDP